MCLGFRERARSYDLFGAPIGVTYKSNYSYQTFAGGCTTIFLLVLFGGNLILSILAGLISPVYSPKTTQKHNLFADTASSNINMRMSTVN